MNQDEYNQGYSTGASSTIDQERGAREAEQDRERQRREEQDRWDAVNRQQADADRQRREAEASARERERARPDSARGSTPERSKATAVGSASAPRAATASGGASSARNFVMVAAFIAGGVLGFRWFPENLIGVGICALIGGVLGAALYKLIIGVTVAIAAIWIWGNVQKDDSAPPEAYATPVAPVEQVVAPIEIAPAATQAPRELQFQNRCRYPMRLSLAWQDMEGQEASGSWDIAATTLPLRLLVEFQPVLPAQPSLLYHATGTGEPVIWMGDVDHNVGGETLPMRRHDLEVAPEGHYLLSLDCDNYVPASVTEPTPSEAFSGPFVTPAELPATTPEPAGDPQ